MKERNSIQKLFYRRATETEIARKEVAKHNAGLEKCVWYEISRHQREAETKRGLPKTMSTSYENIERRMKTILR
jgi:hypothetical protein